MKPFAALITATLGGVATFVVQQAYFPPRAFAASFTVPSGPDWRRQMVERDGGSTAVDGALARLTAKLDLSPDQAKRIRPILEQRHERIVALLLTAPSSLTRDQFMADGSRIRAGTRAQLKGLLTPEQRELVDEFAASARS
jgi:hypothetical protein